MATVLNADGSSAISSAPDRRLLWRAVLPLLLGGLIALYPVPEGLAPHAWYYFALFAAVVLGLVLEPLPSAAIGVLGVVAATILSRWLLFSPADLAKPGFDLPGDSLDWALKGFSSSTVWLVFSAFMFALGYEKTGLGRRIALVLVKGLGRNTLALGYAATAADALLAPFTPSNTARSAGTIFPVVRNLPPLYDSLPHQPSARKIGGYLMWTTFAAGCVTSSLFMTAAAPNLLAVELAQKIAGVEISWTDWFVAAAPFALPLLVVLPLLAYIFYAPTVKSGSHVTEWANSELTRLGKLSRREIILMVLVIFAVLLWVFGGKYVEAATAALLVLSLMLVFRVLTWKEIAANQSAWSTFVLLATLVTLAGGLAKTGFIAWFASSVAGSLHGLTPMVAVMSLVSVYFLSHYMFASLTAHTSAMLPVMLAVGMNIPGVPADKLALALALTTGVMGVITPYATGPAFAYYESGYIPSTHFWRLGTIFGAIFLAALLLIGVPLLMS
jgi:L-tartrate/succinate antiporter